MADKDIFELALARIDQMPEGEEKEQALADLYRDYPTEMKVLEAQYAEGVDNLGTQMPEGRQAGGIYTAANPLEHLTAALRMGYGGYQQKQAREGMQDIASSQQRARTGIAQALMDANTQAQPMNQPNVGPQMPAPQTPVSGNGTGRPAPSSPVTPQISMPNFHQPPPPETNPMNLPNAGPQQPPRSVPSMGFVDRAMQMQPPQAGGGVPSMGFVDRAMQPQPQAPQTPPPTQPTAPPPAPEGMPSRDLSKILRQIAMDEEEGRAAQRFSRFY